MKKDWSNIDDVLTRIKDHEHCRLIAENAYRDIVESGLYTYRNFVKMVIDHVRMVVGDSVAYKPADRYMRRLMLREKYQFVFLVPSFFISNLRSPVRNLFDAVGYSEGYAKLKNIMQR